jgi:hypothetical protein
VIEEKKRHRIKVFGQISLPNGAQIEVGGLEQWEQIALQTLERDVVKDDNSFVALVWPGKKEAETPEVTEDQVGTDESVRLRRRAGARAKRKRAGRCCNGNSAVLGIDQRNGTFRRLAPSPTHRE